ncbi:MAG: DUF4270 family protein [Marinilabiliaceae bacterium]
MLKKRIFPHPLPFILIVLVTILASCEDETGNLGLDVLPEKDLFTGTDTSTHILARNINPGKLQSDDAEYAIIGNVDDKFAGETSASFITQVSTGANIDSVFNKSEDYHVDSLVLNLAYARNWWFGDKDAQHKVNVYRMTSPLSFTQSYSSDMPVEGMYDTEPIGERISSGWDSLPDSVWEDDEYVHQWQFRLDDEVAQEIFNYSEETLDSRNAFKEAFKGIMVRSELASTNTAGSLITLDILAGESNMTLYYSQYEKNEDGEVTDTTQTSYKFPINKECVRINRFEHTHNDAIDFDDAQADNLVAQGMAGSYVEFDLEESIDFEEWEEKLSSAEEDPDFNGISAVDIYFKADTTLQNEDEDFYSPTPRSLRVYQLDEEGSLEEPFFETGQESDPVRRWFSGGEFNEETNEYRFRLAGEYFQKMVEGEEPRGPYYLASPQPISDNRRVILKNNDSEEDPSPRIKIKYVTVKK